VIFLNKLYRTELNSCNFSCVTASEAKRKTDQIRTQQLHHGLQPQKTSVEQIENNAQFANNWSNEITLQGRLAKLTEKKLECNIQWVYIK